MKGYPFWPAKVPSSRSGPLIPLISNLIYFISPFCDFLILFPIYIIIIIPQLIVVILFLIIAKVPHWPSDDRCSGVTKASRWM